VRRRDPCQEEIMSTVEVRVPDDWTPEFRPATARLMSKAVADGVPIVMSVRPTATPGQIRDVYQRIQALLEERGLAA
jgi:hypothetical protein